MVWWRRGIDLATEGTEKNKRRGAAAGSVGGVSRSGGRSQQGWTEWTGGWYGGVCRPG